MSAEHVIPLWPDGPAGSEGWDRPEEEYEPFPGIVGVRNVTQPSLIVYPAQKPTGAAVIIAPGGAWHFLAIEHEGYQVAEWLAARGVTAFVLKYRLIQTGANMAEQVAAFMANAEARAAGLRAIEPLALADAQQAVRIVRQRAAEWGVAPHKIGFMGFSAGGGLTAQIALNYTPDCRPDFAAPIYAAVFEEVEAPADAPPLFLLCASADQMAVWASLALYRAWQAAQLPVELHIYAHGEHGFGMRKMGLPSDTWIERFADWMQGLGMI